jgi:hypothetical protein
MLVGWGATCGRCRPALAAPRTLVLSQLDRSALVAPGLALGWLVVIRSVDPTQVGVLVELSEPLTILSRRGAGRGTGGRVIEFDDEYMSSGHALIRRPRGSARDASFTLQDRIEPGPSANGTFLNSHKLSPTEQPSLSDGDTIRLGATELLFKSLWLPPSGGAP